MNGSYNFQHIGRGVHPATNLIPVNGHNNNIWGFAIGAITGFWNYMGNINGELLSRMAEAGITALICGFLGMAGKEALAAALPWFKKKLTFNRKKDNNGSNRTNEDNLRGTRD